MKNVEINKDGFRYLWTVRGVNEDACIADIVDNSRVELSDYTAAVFAEEFGCVAEVKKMRLMSLNPSVEEFINKRFTSVSYTSSGDACLRGHLNSSVSVRFIADELGCEIVCNQGINGFYKNDSDRLILEFCESDVSLLICSSEKNYVAHLAEFNRFYDIANCNICLEVYFDNVHMDDVFLPRENVEMAISSMLQRGYDGYDEKVKARWEGFLMQQKAPSITFRAIEVPAMARDIDFCAVKPKEDCEISVSQLLVDAVAKCEASNFPVNGCRGQELLINR